MHRIVIKLVLNMMESEELNSKPQPMAVKLNINMMMVLMVFILSHQLPMPWGEKLVIRIMTTNR
jgi:hypothetical protein